MNRMFADACKIGSITLLFLGAAAPAQSHGHGDDFIIGHNDAALPRITIEADPDILSGAESIPLPPGEGAYEDFHEADDPGWISLEEDEPDEGFHMLVPGHQASLKRISFDPGFSMFDPTAGPILENDGDVFLFPLSPEGFIHRHLIFAGDGVEGITWEATFQIVDPSGVHADSEPFTVYFEAVPEPSTVVLLLISGMAVLRRRR